MNEFTLLFSTIFPLLSLTIIVRNRLVPPKVGGTFETVGVGFTNKVFRLKQQKKDISS